MDRKDLAHDYFKEGYNCAQAVIMAFADILPCEEELLLKISSAFGGGFAKTRNICGAVSAIGMIIGLISDNGGNPEENKTEVYRNVRLLTDKFILQNSTLQCGDLLNNIEDITLDFVPSKRTKEYYSARPCVKFVMDCVELIENSDVFIKYMKTIA